jgi:hypothetical protein
MQGFYESLRAKENYQEKDPGDFNISNVRETASDNACQSQCSAATSSSAEATRKTRTATCSNQTCSGEGSSTALLLLEH